MDFYETTEEEGIVSVPIEDFCMTIAEAQVAFTLAENPFWLAPIKVAELAGVETARVGSTKT